MQKKKLKYSIATYKKEDGTCVVSVKELAKTLSHANNVPEKINLTKAMEIKHLSLGFLSHDSKIKKALKELKVIDKFLGNETVKPIIAILEGKIL